MLVEIGKAWNRFAGGAGGVAGELHPGFKVGGLSSVTGVPGFSETAFKFGETELGTLEDQESVEIGGGGAIEIMGTPCSLSEFFGALPVEGAVENLVPHQILKQRKPTLRRTCGGGDE